MGFVPLLSCGMLGDRSRMPTGKPSRGAARGTRDQDSAEPEAGHGANRRTVWRRTTNELGVLRCSRLDCAPLLAWGRNGRGTRAGPILAYRPTRRFLSWQERSSMPQPACGPGWGEWLALRRSMKPSGMRQIANVSRGNPKAWQGALDGGRPGVRFCALLKLAPRQTGMMPGAGLGGFGKKCA